MPGVLDLVDQGDRIVLVGDAGLAVGADDRVVEAGAVAAGALAGGEVHRGWGKVGPRADVCIAVVGDRAGLFGLGTSGEGCDAEDLSLPGVQDELVEALLATGTPVVLLVVSGRPYALGAHADRAAAVVQSFFPGEEGGSALAGVLSGRLTPSGKLPVQVPRTPGGRPGTYLHAPLGGSTQGVSSLASTPAHPFGHGLSYTAFVYDDLTLSAEDIPTDGEVEISCLVRNTGDRPGTEVVQLYTADPVAQFPRPVTQLTGYTRALLAPGEQRRVTFHLHADRLAYTGPDLHRIVEPGDIAVMLGASSADTRLTGTLHLTGPIRRTGQRNESRCSSVAMTDLQRANRVVSDKEEQPAVPFAPIDIAGTYFYSFTRAAAVHCRHGGIGLRTLQDGRRHHHARLRAAW